MSKRQPMLKAAALAVALLSASASFAPAWAGAAGGGSGSVQGENPRLPYETVVSFAKAMERDLAARGAHLAIVFRTGETRDKLPKGISYTHGAFWVHTPIQTVDGRMTEGYAVFNLFHGDGASLPTNRSYLHQDFPADFVAGTAVDDLGVIIPSPEMQRRIIEIMDSPRYAGVHVPRYSLVSNPHDAQFQNCTEFMLDVIAAAVWQTTDYAQLKANLRRNFKPTTVEVGLLARMFGPMVEQRVSMADQSGSVQTATYESIVAFMRENGLLQDAYVFRNPSIPVASAE